MKAPLDPRPNFPALEEEMLSYWKKNKTFEKSYESRPDDKRWTFLDGPPFITGMPHYGTLLSSLPKDLYPRFWTMKGYKVRRVWGWDCHGLPAENKVENKLGLKSKKDIEQQIGIKKFIDECKLYVKDVSSEWEWYVDHIARWVDFKNAYKTMDTPYMESVMWVFKQMYEKGHIYKGMRVSLYCPHCSTPISNFEVAMDNDNYKDVTDSGTVYKFKVHNQENTFILAWSTTPWTKIPTTALAVNPDLTYVKAKVDDETYILAESTLEILKTPYEIVEKMPGKELDGLEFEAHYDYFKIDEGKKAFIVVCDSYVTADEGTGVVTQAAYGEDDLRVMKAQNIHIELHLDDEGHVKENVPIFGGMYYLKSNKAVNEDLANRGLIYADEPLTHSLPHCWRCGTQLYYAPQDAWYVNIQDIKPTLYKNNEKINWFPEHFKQGRFKKSMEFAPDWCISRSRYWGSPVPVWECVCGWRFVPGSLKELSDASGSEVTELHRPDIDEVTVPCAQCGQTAHRVPEVLDSWIEAGSASFAERHYPFSEDKKEDFFPPDFIVEYTGQIRAWFYVLHVIGSTLFDEPSFKNVLVHGTILGTDGRKMSKNFGNYPDPRMMLEKYGGDALRLYLLGAPVMKAEDLIISEEEYRNQIKIYHLPLWNIYNFFDTYSKLDNFENVPQTKNHHFTNILDVWIMESIHKLVQETTDALEKYDSSTAIKKMLHFIDDLSKWYVRRSRDRVGYAAEDASDKQDFYICMNYVLNEFLLISAPVTPFLSETLYKHLTGSESVHLCDWPVAPAHNQAILDDMEKVREFVEVGHRVRKEQKLKVRQPLAKITFTCPKTKLLSESEWKEHYMTLMQDELNVKSVEFEDGETIEAVFDTKLTQDLIDEGAVRELVRTIQGERRTLNLHQTDVITLTLPEYPEKYREYIMQKVNAKTLAAGDALHIEVVKY